MIFVIFLPIPLFIPLFFISVKQQHNHNSQYPEKRSSLYPFPDQLVSISSGKTMNLQIVDSKKTEAVLYCVVGAVMLAVIGFFIYEALNTISQGFHTVILAMLPFSLFAIGIVAGKCFGKTRQRKMQK